MKSVMKSNKFKYYGAFLTFSTGSIPAVSTN